MDLERVSTTFDTDFRIAIPFGIKAIKDTYKNALLYAKTDYKVFTELVMALNHLCWEMHSKQMGHLGQLFADLYYNADQKFYDTFGKNEIACRFFYRITD